jgi:hypothetical protein
MSSLACDCPNPSALTAITGFTCPTNFLQIQRIAFQRAGFTFDGTTGKDITLQADWVALMAATDSTKIVVTPFINEFTITPGEAITFGGGDNTTLNGIAEISGVNPSTASGKLKQAPSTTISKMMKLRCEKNLVVYLFNEAGQIICLETVLASGDYIGIAIQAFFIGDKAAEGYATIDSNMFSFQIPKDWSATSIIVTPAFNPLTAL